MADIWDQAKTEYINGGTSYRKLAEKYGLSRVTLEKRAKAEDWVGKRRQLDGKRMAKTIDILSDQKADRAARLQTVADKLLGKVEALVDTSPLLDEDTGAMKDVARVLKDIKEIQGIKSDADMREQEARIKSLQAKSETNDPLEGKTYGVIMLPEIKPLEPPEDDVDG